jgi:hypothetical protein
VAADLLGSPQRDRQVAYRRILLCQRAYDSPRRRMASVQGLPSGLSGVNCWSTAELAGEDGPSTGMQRLLSTAAWAEAGVATGRDVSGECVPDGVVIAEALHPNSDR